MPSNIMHCNQINYFQKSFATLAQVYFGLNWINKKLGLKEKLEKIKIIKVK